MRGLRLYGILMTAAAVACGALVVLGGAVCFLGAAKAIPDWPAAFGGVAPPAEAGAFVEYLHRIAAAVVGLLVLASAVAALAVLRARPWLVALPLAALGLLALVSTIGALVVLGSVPPVVAAVDLGSALLVFALTIAASRAAYLHLREPGGGLRFAFGAGFPRFALAVGAAVWLVLGMGLSVGNPAPGNCLGLPLWIGSALLAGGEGWLSIVHLLVSAAAGALVVALAVAAWFGRRVLKGRFPLALSALACYAVSLVSGELAATAGFPWGLMAVRVASAALLWACLSALIARETFSVDAGSAA